MDATSASPEVTICTLRKCEPLTATESKNRLPFAKGATAALKRFTPLLESTSLTAHRTPRNVARAASWFSALPLATGPPSTGGPPVSARTTMALRYLAASHPPAEYTGCATTRTRPANVLANGYSHPCANSREGFPQISAGRTPRVSVRGTLFSPAAASRSASAPQNTSCASCSSGKSYMGSDATQSALIVIQADIRTDQIPPHHFPIPAGKHQSALERRYPHLLPKVRELKPGELRLRMMRNVQIVIQEQQRPERMRLNHAGPQSRIVIGDVLGKRPNMVQRNAWVDDERQVHPQGNVTHPDHPNEHKPDTHCVTRPDSHPP